METGRDPRGTGTDARGRRVLVTGASRGIGRAIALALADAGFDVAISARTGRRGQGVHSAYERALPGSLEETAAQIDARGQRSLALPCDLTDVAAVEAAVAELIETWGGADVVINNGRYIGPGLMEPLLGTDLQDYRRFVEAHAIAPIRVAQLLLPGMLERGGGTFVTVSSSQATDYYPDRAPRDGKSGLGYRLGKTAGHMLAGALLAEHGEQGIRAFNVNPGLVITERNAPDLAKNGYDAGSAAPPAAIGAVVAWLVTSAEADSLMRQDNHAQPLALERGLHPDWNGTGVGGPRT
jgi:NAD(P)-dependent dehydrogenase (short-subunit alcohol dehydrogenase family)